MKKKSIILIAIILITIFTPLVEAKNDKTIIKKTITHKVKPDKPGKPPKTDTNEKYWYKVSSLSWYDPSPEITYEINLMGSGLPSEAINDIVACFEIWDDATSAELFSSYTTSTRIAGEQDGYNVLSFGPTTVGTIAVTTIWYYQSNGQIVEIDTLFNTYYEWTQDGDTDSDKMDLENIATHEIGHWLVLEDLYKRPAIQVTMFGYSGYGETSKETLEIDDIKGVEAIYGP